MNSEEDKNQFEKFLSWAKRIIAETIAADEASRTLKAERVDEDATQEMPKVVIPENKQ